MKLKDRVAIVTGSSRGIGRAIALKLGGEGAKVVVNYSRSRKEAENVVKELENLGTETIAVIADVSKAKDVNRMVNVTLESYGRIDILVNNAGVYKRAPLNGLNEMAWKRILDVNLKGVFLCTKAVSKTMFDQKIGHIVNISSTAGIYASPSSPAYSSSKAGVIGFTRSVAEWFAPYVKVNAIVAGWIENGLSAGLPQEVKTKIESQIPLKRFGKAEEIANVVLFLVSEPHYMTGQILVADGGLGNVNWII